MKKNTSLFLAISATLVMSACNQDPYASVKGQIVTVRPPIKVGDKPFTLEAPDSIDCVEGKNCETYLKGHVSEGEPVVTINNRPRDATYDAATGHFTYTPAYDVVDVATDPSQTIYKTDLSITVSSSLNPSAQSTYTIPLSVKNTMRPTTIKIVSGAKEIDEGETLSQVVQVSNPDFPNGPYFLSLKNAPNGTTKEAVNGSPGLFTVKFTPNYFFVTSRDDGYSTFHRNTVVTYLGNTSLDAPVEYKSTWTVNDVRKDPLVTAPDMLTQGLDVNFTVHAEDVNGEMPPTVSVDPSSIPFGIVTLGDTVTTQASADNVYPSTMVNVHWDQLKPENLGTTTDLKLNVCASTSRHKKADACTSKVVRVSLKGNLHPTPVIDRSAWVLGSEQNLRVGDALEIALPSIDAESPALPLTLQVTPASVRDQVSWEAGVLKITPKHEGMLQFNLEAESVYGQIKTESFVADVLPAAWARTVIFTGEMTTGESFSMSKLSPLADLLSVKNQVSSRNLTLRDSAILTSEFLGSSFLSGSALDQIYDHFNQYVISTPLLRKMSGKILAASLSENHIQLKGRFLDVAPNGTVLNDMILSVDSSSGLALPNAALSMGLKGTLTNESKSPMVFDLSQMSSNCTRLLSLQKRGLSLDVGVKCTASDGKVFYLLGFELADVLVDSLDSALTSKWLDSMTIAKGRH